MEDIIKDFVKFVSKKLNMDELPEVRIEKNPKFAVSNKTFGIYFPDDNSTTVEVYGRNIVDVLRTVAHELTHHRQNEVNSKKSRVDLEIEATVAAGMLVKIYCEKHPQLYKTNEIAK